MAETALPVLHGIDQCVPSYAKMPDKGNMGSETLTEDLFTKHVYDADSGVWLPIDYIAARWDFDSDGGAIGDIGLGVVVPAGTIILDGIINVLDPITSGGEVTIALHVEDPEDVMAAEDLGTISGVGLYDVVPVGTAATMIKTSDARTITMTVAVAALTAGALVVSLRCVRGFLS